MNLKKLFFILLAILVIASAYFGYSLFFTGDNSDNAANLPEETPAENNIVDLQILCVGDIMYHQPQLNSANNGDGTYSFDEEYKYIKPYIENADLAICNLETTFGGEPYTGYPTFSTPDNLAATLKTVGFDVAATANNHVNDRGLAGIDRTLSVLTAENFAVTGSRSGEGMPRWTEYTIKEVRVGVLAYTYQTPSAPGSISINGNYISNEVAARLNTFGYEDVDAETAKIQQQVLDMKNAGIDVVVLYMHWGEEYQIAANPYQRYFAEKLAANPDIDVIFGSHPHTLQEMEAYNERVPVYFSLGNFISNQRTETLNNRYTETGAIGRVVLEYDLEKKSTLGISADAVPTWVEKYSKDGKNRYYIIPLDENLESNPELATSGHLQRAQNARNDAAERLGRLQLTVNQFIEEDAEQSE